MIKILHLYYDLLNLSGEQGNILALEKAFNNQNVEVKLYCLSVDDKIKFSDYDLIYMGNGSNSNFSIALEDIKKYKKELKKYIDNNGYVIATGNSYLLFGEKINDIDCLGIFDYYAKWTNRTAHECLMGMLNQKDIIGFQNRDYVVNINRNHLFKVKDGICDNLKSENEGYHENNFYGTSVIGPLLIRNPHLTNMIVKDILEKNNLVFHDDEFKLLNDAYNEYIKNFYS